MPTLDDLLATYRGDLLNGDPVRAEVARRQLARIERVSLLPAMFEQHFYPSRWAHVPVAALFAEAGNRVRGRADGTLETGHEPFHRSKSGACVLIVPTTGRWVCRSCRRSGDAARFLIDLHGASYAAAATELERRFGRGHDRPNRRPGRARWLEA